MQDENDQKRFIEIFKALSKILTSLQTFVEFPYERNRLDLTEQEWEDYKSKYYLLYRTQVHLHDPASILNDIDFCIELIESDHINIAYIMNLIQTIDINDLNKRKKQIKYLRELLDRSTNSELYKKIDLIKAFLDQLENGISGETIDIVYETFEAQERQKDINTFLESNPEISKELLTGYISEYEFSFIIDEGEIRDSITAPMGLLKKKSLVRRIVDFIKLFAEKYQ